MIKHVFIKDFDCLIEVFDNFRAQALFRRHATLFVGFCFDGFSDGVCEGCPECDEIAIENHRKFRQRLTSIHAEELIEAYFGMYELKSIYASYATKTTQPWSFEDWCIVGVWIQRILAPWYKLSV
jgi:hypothetical protein